MSGDFSSKRTVVATRHHRCEEAPTCTRKIKPGDTYIRLAGKWDSEFYAVKLCTRCDRLHDRAARLDPEAYYDGEGATFGDLLGWIREARR